MKIALSMICKGLKDDAPKLKRALNSIYKYVDGIYITLSAPRNLALECEAVCKKFKANVSYNSGLWTADKETVNWLRKFFEYEPNIKVGDKLFLFDEARNYNLAQIPKEYGWLLWIDCDDVVRNAQNLEKVRLMAEQRNIEAVYFNYLYQVELIEDENPPEQWKIKNIIIEHIRERLVRNNDKFKWIAPIHETLIEQVPTEKTDNYDVEILHLSTKEDKIESLTRNLPNLELAVAKTEGKDPRHLYYLAKAYFDKITKETDERAIPLILAYLNGENKSGWPQERAQACMYLAEIYRRNGQSDKSIRVLMNALIESPEDPSIFVNIAIDYASRKEWERALFWVKLALQMPDVKTTLVKNPRDLIGMSLEVIYNASINLGKIDEAWAAAEKLKELDPNHPQVKHIHTFINQLREQRDIAKIIVKLTDYLKATGEYHKIKPLLSATPKIAENTPFIIDLKMKNNPPRAWEKNEIVIYCGPGFTIWSPKRLDNPQGSFIGGSEEAVIRMSSELQKQGWKVTVYADPGTDEGDYDGVQWLPYFKFNSLDNFNIVIAWRNPKFFTQGIKAKKKYVWCHDIQNPLDYSDEVIKSVNKFFFLSKWHRDNVSKLPENKVFLTTNGI
ncbi:MAG: hypothetical protein KKH98_09095 [Spirochaetes bacterium]|nr:hypothetical protein [Spirochaetota bacterium]